MSAEQESVTMGQFLDRAAETVLPLLGERAVEGEQPLRAMIAGTRAALSAESQLEQPLNAKQQRQLVAVLRQNVFLLLAPVQKTGAFLDGLKDAVLGIVDETKRLSLGALLDFFIPVVQKEVAKAKLNPEMEISTFSVPAILRMVASVLETMPSITDSARLHSSLAVMLVKRLQSEQTSLVHLRELLTPGAE